MKVQTERIEDCFRWLQKEFEHSDEVQSTDILIDKLDLLCSALPFINQQMALTKKLLNEAKVSAYQTLQCSSAAQERYYAPSLAKDYVAAQCSKEAYAYDLCERCSRTIIHILDSLRTMISALKQESIVSQYSSNVMR